MRIRVLECDHRILDMRTRMPFRYGIAEMKALPHLILRVSLEIDGKRGAGWSADSLAPKWFTKNPHESFDDELRGMFDVILHASGAALGLHGENVFRLWHELYHVQSEWAAARACPPLLASFGVSLVERAIIDAFCRITGRTFSHALRDNSLGIDCAVVHEELAGLAPAELLPPPRRQLSCRHTIGCADPLVTADIPPGERIEDGLPQSLEEVVAAYGLTFFKIKLYGHAEQDIPRLKQIANVLAPAGDRLRFTLDGNEQFHSLGEFRQYWEALGTAGSEVTALLRQLLFVEQPLHRDVALGNDVAGEMGRWRNRPRIIIDESDASIDSLARAFECGYAGTSHKNCKGVFKSIAHAALMHHRRRRRLAGNGQASVHSAEDLVNIGPIALLQDLAVVACLGIDHVERNGHHYFRGLTMWPEDVQQRVLQLHGDLYQKHPRGFPTVGISRGLIDLNSVVEAPFGVGLELDASRFTPLSRWRASSIKERQT